MFSELPDTSDASSGSSPLAPINSLLPKELALYSQASGHYALGYGLGCVIARRPALALPCSL